MKKKFLEIYIKSFKESLKTINFDQLNKCVKILKDLRKNKGRLFIIGVGGSAGNASHAASDFRKLCNIDAYSPADNITEITAKTNDEGFDTIFDTYLQLSKLRKKDVLMVFSVGGGNEKKNVSVNLINGIKFAKNKKSKIISIIGRSDGYAFKESDVKILIKVKNNKLVTPISETFQALLWHLFVSHPQLQINKTKW